MKYIVRLFLVFTLLFVACSEDETVESIQNSSLDNKQELILTLVSLNELVEKSSLQKPLRKLYNKIDVLKNNTNLRDITSNDGSFTILTDTIKQLTDGERTTYTFLIETPTHPESVFENFILQQEADNTFKYFIYRYRDNEEIPEFPYSITVEEIPEDQVDIIEFLDYTTATYHYDEESDCLFFLIPDGCCLYFPQVICCPCGGGGSSAGTGPPEGFGGPPAGTGDGGDPTTSGNDTDPGGGTSGYQSTEGIIYFPTAPVYQMQAWEQLSLCLSNLSDDDRNFLENNKSIAKEIRECLDPLGTGGCGSPEAQAFALLSIEALDSDGIDDGEVDCEDRIIIDSTFLNHPRLKCVYDKFKNGTNTVSNYLENFMGETPVAHLELKADDNFEITYPSNTGAGAVTNPPVNYLINITFNTDPDLPSSSENFPTIILAVEMIHEMIHAEIFRKLLSCAQLPNVNYQNYSGAEWTTFITNLRNDFPGLYDYFIRYAYGDGDQDHQLMAQHYIDIVVQSLKDFDSNAHTDEFYNALAWIGLKETVSWNNLLQEDRDAIDLIIINAVTDETHECTN